jgi:hypothetical protein
MGGWSWAQELRNNRNLPQVHKRRRVADFRKFDQFRARPAPGHFLRDPCWQNVTIDCFDP